MPDFATHADYIEEAAEPLKPLLQNLYEQLRAALPDADEIIAYNMPGFSLNDKIVAGYAAFSKQCGLYVAHDAIDALREDLIAIGLKPTKTGVTFSPKKPLPDQMIQNLAFASLKANGVEQARN